MCLLLKKFEFLFKVIKFLKIRILVNYCEKIENEIKIFGFLKKKKSCYYR